MWPGVTLWAVAGVLWGFGLVGILTIGMYFLPGAAVLTVIGLANRRLRNQGPTAFLAGLAAIPLWMAWLNRGGPGDVCTRTAGGESCLEAWSPWPFVAVGVVLLAAGIWLTLQSASKRKARVGAVPLAA
jgi:hypothetical protein